MLRTDRRTDGQTDGQAQTYMPRQLLRSWGHNYYSRDAIISIVSLWGNVRELNIPAWPVFKLIPVLGLSSIPASLKKFRPKVEESEGLFGIQGQVTSDFLVLKDK